MEWWALRDRSSSSNKTSGHCLENESSGSHAPDPGARSQAMSRLCIAATRSPRLVERAFGQLRGMLRVDAFSARGVALDMGLRPPVLPAGSVAAAAAVFLSRPGGCRLLRHERGLFVLTGIIPVM